MKKSILIIICAFSYFTDAMLAQSKQPNFTNGKDVFGTRVFIENKGQFDKEVRPEAKVHYAFITDQEKIFFTDKGLIHKLVRMYPLTEKQKEAQEHGLSFFKREPTVYTVNMNWLNSNQNIQIESSEKQSHYFTYWKADLISNTFKKITYKNVYNHIDIEYIIPEDKTQGVKYTVILHPGANPDDIKIAYSGDVDKIKTNSAGDVIIKTPLEDLTEHFPISFSSANPKVNSRFILKNNILSFQFPDDYDRSKTLFVDPWLTTVTTLTTNNQAYDVDYDDNGNVFIYGGGGFSDFKVAKYSAAGVLQWTFSGFLTVPAWSTTDISNFVVIRSTGKSYVGQGWTNGGSQIIRLDANGVYDNLITPAAITWNEIWDLAYHCSTGNVYGMGGSTASNQSAGIINQTTGNLVPTHFIGPYNTTDVGNDVVNYAIDDAGEFFWVYASNFTPTLSNQMAKINAAFTNTLWVAPTGYTTLAEYTNKNDYIPQPTFSNGYNCLAVNASYLYFYDGRNVAAYNKTTGAQVASTVITSHVLKRQGGIAVDDCDNLYLGGNDTIKSLHFNGTSFSVLPNILIGVVGSTNSAVYDLKIERFTKTLYASGKEFVGTYGASNTATCTPLNIICYNPNAQEIIICAGSNVTLTPSNFLNLASPVFSVQPGALSNTTGTFVLAPLSNINYTTYVTGTSTNNVVLTLTAVVNVTVNVQPAVAPSFTQATCTSTVNGFNLNLTFVPSNSTTPYTIAWPVLPFGILSNTSTASSGGIAGGTYTANITTQRGCSLAVIFTINPVPEPASFTISPNAPYTISCFHPSLELTYFPPSLSYTTSNNLNTVILGTPAVFTSSISSGTWVVTALNPVSGCVSTRTFVINSLFTVPSSTVSPLFQNITCSVSSIAPVIAFSNPIVNVSHSWLSPQGASLTVNSATASFLPGGPGTFTHCVIDNASGCSTCKTFTVTSSDGFPTYSLTSPQNFTLGCSTKSVATINIINANTAPTPGGPVSYTIIGPPTGPAASGILSSLSSYTVNVPGTWTVITKDNTNLCETRVQLSVLQNTFTPDISATVPQQVLSCNVPSVILQGLSLTQNVSYNWSFPSTPGNVAGNTITVMSNTAATTNTNIANYTLTIVDNSSTCRSTSVVPMYQNLFKPNAVIAGGNQLTCVTLSLVLTNMSSSTIPPAAFGPMPGAVIAILWEGPSPQVPLTLGTTYVATMPGAYTMTAKDSNNGCISVTTKTVADFREYPYVNKPNGTLTFTLDCGTKAISIAPTIDKPTPGLTYTWVAPSSFTTSSINSASLTVEDAGVYQVLVSNSLNGCTSRGVITVVDGALAGDFIPDVTQGFAPLSVEFTNNSKSTLGDDKITSVWSFGNGISTITYSSSVKPTTVYNLPGTYSVALYVTKGKCMDTVMKYIQVDIPSQMEVPNIFSPNGDNINDVFFLKATNLQEISIVIYDRWGHKVYELANAKSNVEWDGKNSVGKDVPDGVYNYILTALGTDGKSYDTKGNITLVR